jgi:hypothetical protein
MGGSLEKYRIVVKNSSVIPTNMIGDSLLTQPIGGGEAYLEFTVAPPSLAMSNLFADEHNTGSSLNNTAAGGERNTLTDAKIRLRVSPTPSSDDAMVSYTLPRDCSISVSIINTINQEIQTIVSSRSTPQGIYSQKINCSQLSSGVYTLRLVVYSTDGSINVVSTPLLVQR